MLGKCSGNHQFVHISIWCRQRPTKFFQSCDANRARHKEWHGAITSFAAEMRTAAQCHRPRIAMDKLLTEVIMQIGFGCQ